ncbi:MAG: hypothetical protein A2381_14625 [Bdellovibrionales bacterium RIFOXYB1_FULL_37_110]|nr:MAG: hypothetical protein A2417_08825 [Bdellovibrionales bacterium RIFOXYC1_FULL_37_79]OFZ60388.1 MAG: hypothetical protein A2381_14625 [Bdellovibrionales bacterium RIFOXYB1_FULL_37_110]OFZ64870.1 MAG: hypothetical protein A2577_15915 [Bdellovibrionales bacterium RIFOXYD1_FULL_36_51]
MKKIKILTTNSYFSAFVSGIVISSAIFLSSSIVYATESNKFECPELSNKILTRQDLGTFLTPGSFTYKIEDAKDSLKYTQSLAKLELERDNFPTTVREDIIKRKRRAVGMHLRELSDSLLQSNPEKEFNIDVSIDNSLKLSDEDGKEIEKTIERSKEYSTIIKKIKELKDNFNASPAMQHLINKNLHFDRVIQFISGGKQTEFIYNGNTLVAIAGRNIGKIIYSPVDEMEWWLLGNRSLITTDEDVLILNNCKISHLAHIGTTKLPDREATYITNSWTPALCKNLHLIKPLAVKIKDDADDFKYNCEEQGGEMHKKYDNKKCWCGIAGRYIDTSKEACVGKKRKVKTPPWEIFENFVKKYAESETNIPNLEKRCYTKATYGMIEKKCSEYEGHWDTPDSEIKDNDKNSSNGPGLIMQN